jgi:putative Mg2+ transporter-C (MgtC) family protein
VRGLTTAAGIWAVGAIGLAVGAGSYGLALVATFLVLFLLASENLLHIDARIEARRQRQKDRSPGKD